MYNLTLLHFDHLKRLVFEKRLKTLLQKSCKIFTQHIIRFIFLILVQQILISTFLVWLMDHMATLIKMQIHKNYI